MATSTRPVRPALPIHTLAIFGVGLIGGSLAMALKKAKAVHRIIGVDRSLVNLRQALAAGVIDAIQTDPVQAATEAEMVVLATPVKAITELIATIAPVLPATTIVTDVGSVKGEICEAARRYFGARIDCFVPGHPIAGREKSGITAAMADLFANHKVILTPLTTTAPAAFAQVRAMWQAAGAEVKLMEIAEHDRVLSITSHLPHVLAYVMMDFLAQAEARESCYEMAAGGFYDFTRTATSDPVMWRDICMTNAPQILADLARYQRQLTAVTTMLEQRDHKAIEKLFTAAKQARARVPEKRKF